MFAFGCFRKFLYVLGSRFPVCSAKQTSGNEKKELHIPAAIPQIPLRATGSAWLLLLLLVLSSMIQRSAVAQHTGMGTQQQQEKKKRSSKTSKEVYFSVLPDRYEPLLEEQEEEEEEEHRRKRKRRFKKYRKNMLKALRFVSSCMMLGLQYAAGSYASPASVVTVVTQVQRGRGSSRT